MNRIKFLATFSLIICSLLASFLIGALCLYKSYDFLSHEASDKLLYLTRQQATELGETFVLTEKSVELLTKISSDTFSTQRFNKVKDKLYKYDENNLPYVSEYFNEHIKPVVTQVLLSNDFVQGAYFNFTSAAFKHKDMICVWGTKGINKKLVYEDCGPLDDYKNIDLPEYEWFAGPIKTGKGYWTNLYEDKDIHVTMISYTEPFYVNNKIIGVTGVDISLENIRKRVESLKVYNTGFASILDKEFKIIFSKKYKPKEDMSKLIDLSKFNKKNKEGVLESNRGNNDVFISYSYLPNGYILMLEVPKTEVLGDVNVLKDQILIISLLILGFSVLISIKLGDYIAEPFEKLKEISQRLVERDYSIKIDDNYNIDEIKSFVSALKQFIKVSRENQKNKELIDSIFNSLVDVLLVINEKGIIFSVNPVIEDIFGYTQKEIIGKPVDTLFQTCFFNSKDNFPCIPNDYNYVNGKIEINCVRKDFSPFPAEVGINELTIGNKSCYTLLIRDITYHKEIENMKNEFVSIVSHELRTPLTSIQGALGLVNSKAVGEVPEKAQELLDIALNNTIRLKDIINDILDIEKIEAGKIKYEFISLNLSNLIKESIDLNKPYGEKHHVNFVYENSLPDLNITTDKNRLLQVLSNLLSNAAKFSKKGQDVQISNEIIDNKIRISVKDNGIGIPDEYKDRIFEKFFQVASSTTRKIGGTGLGLSICKLIVNKLGGTINFDSKQGEGTTFYFDLTLTSDRIVDES